MSPDDRDAVLQDARMMVYESISQYATASISLIAVGAERRRAVKGDRVGEIAALDQSIAAWKYIRKYSRKRFRLSKRMLSDLDRALAKDESDPTDTTSE
jgi:hypothetical protein